MQARRGVARPTLEFDDLWAPAVVEHGRLDVPERGHDDLALDDFP